LLLKGVKMVTINFGYACISLSVPNCSTAKTVTATNLRKIADPAERLLRLRRVAQANLTNTVRLLWFNKVHRIKLYRFSSQLVPLATHPLTTGWDYVRDLAGDFRRVGEVVKENGLRVSMHPGQYTVLSSPNPAVVQRGIADLEYHANVLNAMGLGTEAKLVLHVGGAYQGKTQAMERFVANFKRLRQDIQERLVLENDDTTYSAQDVLGLCRRLGIPMVLDVHHWQCLNDGESLADLVPAVFATWHDLPPKIHFSSPKSERELRAHADYVNAADFKAFLAIAGNADFDVMIEAKAKEKALFKLWEEIRWWQ